MLTPGEYTFWHEQCLNIFAARLADDVSDDNDGVSTTDDMDSDTSDIDTSANDDASDIEYVDESDY